MKWGSTSNSVTKEHNLIEELRVLNLTMFKVYVTIIVTDPYIVISTILEL